MMVVYPLEQGDAYIGAFCGEKEAVDPGRAIILPLIRGRAPV
jgi:hypothetical protein